VRVFRSLDSIVGNEQDARQWLNSQNNGLNERPIHLICQTEGLVRVDINAKVVDLQRKPFNANAKIWQHPTDYMQTQQFARTAREIGVEGILYKSARDITASWCFALLTPRGFAKPKPYGANQTWFMAVSQQTITLRRDSEAMQFSTEGWR
jgi:hypothetical protein